MEPASPRSTTLRCLLRDFPQDMDSHPSMLSWVSVPDKALLLQALMFVSLPGMDPMLHMDPMLRTRPQSYIAFRSAAVHCIRLN